MEVIDSLLVTLGLDASKFKKEQKDAQDSLNKTKNESHKVGKSMESDAKKISDSFKKVKTEAITLLSIFTAGVGIKNFAVNTINSATALGNLASNLGMSTERLTAWERAARDAGGSAQEMGGFLKELQTSIGKYNAGLGSEKLATLAAYGGNVTEALKGPEQFAKQINIVLARLYKNNPANALAVAGMLGVSEGNLNLLRQSTEEVNKQVDAEQKHEVITKLNAAQAKELRANYLDLRDTFSATGQIILFSLVPSMREINVQLQKAGDYILAHREEISSFVNDIADDFETVAKYVNKAVTATVGWKAVIEGLMAIKLAQMTAGFLGLGTSIVSVANALKMLAATGAMRVLGPLWLLFHSRNLDDDKGGRVEHIIDLERKAAKNGVKLTPGMTLEDLEKAANAKPSDSNDAKNGENNPDVPKGIRSDNPDAPRGIRNNNPGNIKYGSYAKKMGAIGVDANGFAVFQNLQQGETATRRLLGEYKSQGIDTISGILNKWAPPGDNNNTEAYIQDASKQLGVSRYDHLKSSQLDAMAQAIFAHENGAKAWAKVRGGDTTTNSSETKIGQINIHTQATDAAGIAKTIDPAIKRYTFSMMANTGIS
ncbi:MAG: hypothetical protein KGI54_14920 [Pseudomonadota bacterium]|nr:hypothetical protein [Pseudomonadota bacterium]